MEGLVKTFLLTASVLSCLGGNQVAAAPSGYGYGEALNTTHPFAEFGLARSPKRQSNVPLRILSLGASIMSGVGSSTGNGLRKSLRDALRQDGFDVNMVGSLHSGDMVDWNHEAVPGDVLTQILARVPHSTGFKPNIVIINGGTNDGNFNVDIANVGTRMNDVLNALWNADGMADTCIMLSALIPTTNSNGQANRATINSQYSALASQRAGEGKCIYFADMDLPGGVQWLQFDTDYLVGESPHVHPNDAGHRKMAAAFYTAIYHAIDDNRLVTPGDFLVGPSTCDKFAGTGIDAGGLTQRGSGYDDGIYYHDSEEMGILWTADSDWDRGQWKFARLFDQDFDDLLAWISYTDTSQIYAVWANSADGKGSFTQMSDLVPDLNCEYPEGVNFIDMNGDGLDDLVYIDADGNAYLSINQGDGNRASGKSPTFKRVSDTAMIKSTEAYSRDYVVLGDIDGDGRGDYGSIDRNGNVNFWRNGGTGDAPEYWQALGQRLTAPGFGDERGFRFEDVNGDGRDDFVWLSDVGVGYVYTNGRSCAKGVEGDGLNVAWRQGFYTGQSSGPAYKGMGSFVTDDEDYLRDRVHLARIYGKSTVFGNLPKQDYVFMQHTKKDGKHHFDMHVWKNTGSGGSKLLADGNKYCNMMGHSNGMMDYVWAYSFGRMEMWANRGKGTISDSDPEGFWNYQGTIWTPPSDMNRRDLHLQDWDGDGDCDIIYADPTTGAVQVWINNYPETGNWDWTYLSNPAPGVTCSQKRGLGMFDLAVRFADITGNKRADYLCIEPDTRITGYTHNDDGSFADAGQIKVSIDKDRANLRFADVNGDGTDDLLWVEKFSGDAYVYYNNGPADPASAAGSSFGWRVQDEVAYAGLSAGTCLYWPDLDGNGRADEHYILGTFNNEARTSMSPSCGLQDVTGDDASFEAQLTAELAEYGTGSGGGGSDGDDSNTGFCSYDADAAASWEGSGAATLLNSYIGSHGTGAWLKSMDIEYYTHDQSTINCDSISSNDCSAPDTSCSSYENHAYWYVKTMASRLNSHFKSAHETLQNSAIRDLGQVDQMLLDFKEEVPDNDDLANVFKTLALTGTIAGVFAKRATAYAGDFLTLLGAGLNLASNGLKTDPASYDEIAGQVKTYITDILDNGSNWIDSILPEFFGDGDDGDLSLVTALLAELKDAGLATPQDDRTSDISAIMDGGGFMVPVSKSSMNDALSASISSSLLSVLGHVLAGLHYMVVGAFVQVREACELTYGAQWIDEACYYLVVRAKGASKSKNADQEQIDKMQNTYGMNMVAMYKNIAACNNADTSSDGIYVGGSDDDYGPCWFGIPYVKVSGALDYPIIHPDNGDTLPDWIEKADDLWNEPRIQICKLDAYKDATACKAL